VSFVTSVLILLPFLSVAQKEWGTRKVISWSVAVYSKKIASQCNLTAQIEPVQDKMPLTDTGARLLNKYWCQLITIDFFLVLYQPYYQSLIKQHQLMNQSKIYVWKIMNDCQLDPGWNIWYAVAGLKFLWGTIIQNVIWFWHKYRNC
jgi:hypothetical protein